jgi:hypothetical protein
MFEGKQWEWSGNSNILQTDYQANGPKQKRLKKCKNSKTYARKTPTMSILNPPRTLQQLSSSLQTAMSASSDLLFIS